MSYFCCCFGGSEPDVITPADPEVRRKQMLAAAEKRQKEAEYRGIKDTQKFEQQKKRNAKMEEMEKKGAQSSANDGGMRWQVG